MNRKTRSILIGISIIFALIATLMKMHIVVVPSLVGYEFWIVIIAFALVLISK